jgi:hypothetical protein
MRVKAAYRDLPWDRQCKRGGHRGSQRYQRLGSWRQQEEFGSKL